MKDKKVLSLFDYSGNMVKPWAEAGYTCYCVDKKHEGRTTEKIGDGEIHYIEAEINDYIPPKENYKIIFAAPPCTDLAVSGARWFKEKGLSGLSNAIELVERADRICQWADEDTPWLIENPVSTLSTYWREPDYTFHPYEYDDYTETDNAYSKKTCLWTSENLVMPDTEPAEKYDDRIHKMPPSEDRSEKRSRTPIGFANAVYHANK